MLSVNSLKETVGGKDFDDITSVDEKVVFTKCFRRVLSLDNLSLFRCLLC